MSRLRSILTAIVFLTAFAAGGLSLALFGPREHEAIKSYNQVPWLSALLLAYCFGTVVVPLALADIQEPIIRILNIWVELFVISATIWLVPLLLAPYFGWSWGGCFSASMIIIVLASLLEPLVELGLKMRKKRLHADP